MLYKSIALPVELRRRKHARKATVSLFVRRVGVYSTGRMIVNILRHSFIVGVAVSHPKADAE